MPSSFMPRFLASSWIALVRSAILLRRKTNTGRLNFLLTSYWRSLVSEFQGWNSPKKKNLCHELSSSSLCLPNTPISSPLPNVSAKPCLARSFRWKSLPIKAGILDDKLVANWWHANNLAYSAYREFQIDRWLENELLGPIGTKKLNVPGAFKPAKLQSLATRFPTATTQRFEYPFWIILGGVPTFQIDKRSHTVSSWNPENHQYKLQFLKGIRVTAKFRRITFPVILCIPWTTSPRCLTGLLADFRKAFLLSKQVFQEAWKQLGWSSGRWRKIFCKPLKTRNSKLAEKLHLLPPALRTISTELSANWKPCLLI